jgi:hypothetical protein
MSPREPKWTLIWIVKMFFKRKNLFSMVDRINPNLKTYILQHFVHGLCAMTKEHQIFLYIVKMFNFIWFEPKKPQAGYGQTYEYTYCISQLSIQRKLMTIKWNVLLIALPPSFHPFIFTHGHVPTFTFVVITRTSTRKGIKFATWSTKFNYLLFK